MTAFSQIEASLADPTVTAVASAVLKQVAAVGDGRKSFGLEAQMCALDEAKARLQSIGVAREFAFGWRVTDGEALGGYFDQYQEIIGGKVCPSDERPTQFAWEDNANGCTYLYGLIVDAGAEYGRALILPRDTCVMVFGKDRVSAWENAETLRQQDIGR